MSTFQAEVAKFIGGWALFIALSVPRAVGALTGPSPDVQTVVLEAGRPVAIVVPVGFKFEQARDADGAPRAVLNAADGTASLDLLFLPDPDGRALRLRGRNELMAGIFHEFVAGSVEKAMEFEELTPKRGSGTFCVFTDALLVGKAELPRGEYHHLTVGVKAWEGVMLVFRLFSQDLKSEAHMAAMRVLRESVEERPVPLR